MRLVVLVSVLAMALPGCEGRKRAIPTPPAPQVVELPGLRATDGATEWKIDDKNIMLRVQGRLQDLGIYLGAVDGSYRKEVEAALMQFQAARGLKATGVIDAETADALGLPAKVTTPGAEAKPVKAPTPDAGAPEARAPMPAPRALPSVAAGPGQGRVDVAPAGRTLPAGPAGQAPAGQAPLPQAPVEPMPEPPGPEAYTSPPSAAVPLEPAAGSAAPSGGTPKPGI